MRYYCVKQHDITDCGAACLATICKQNGYKVGITKIREVAGTDKQGANAFGIIKAAEQLRQKLLSPMPPEKKVSKYRLYKCKWQLGDVFAYRLDSEYSKEKGVYGQYIIFRKVSEDRWWPGHIVPSVHVYKWIGENIPTLDEIVTLPLLPQKYIPIAYVNNPNDKKEYMFNLLVSMEKQIPKDKLTFIGNIQGEDIVAYKDIANYYSGNAYTEWKDFEYKTLKQYFAWKNEN